jgi:UDP-2,3-diacylglucosamine pyrophosphatase LpxH
MTHVEYHRTIFVSDLHLGSRACRVELLLDFLAHARCDMLYLVGDVIDLRSLRRSFYWPKSHTEVLQRILEKARADTRVVYVPGNHDDDFRALAGMRFSRIEIEQRCVHTTAAGKRLLVLHGDEFDSTLKCGPLAALVGHVGYRLLLAVNRLNHRLDALMGRPYWSLAQSLKLRVGKAVRYISGFQNACLDAAREADLDGVVCGHIHKADILERDGLVYCNDGDWVESCTALVESPAGELSLRHWGQVSAARERPHAVPLSDAA